MFLSQHHHLRPGYSPGSRQTSPRGGAKTHRGHSAEAWTLRPKFMEPEEIHLPAPEWAIANRLCLHTASACRWRCQEGIANSGANGRMALIWASTSQSIHVVGLATMEICDEAGRQTQSCASASLFEAESGTEPAEEAHHAGPSWSSDSGLASGCFNCRSC